LTKVLMLVEAVVFVDIMVWYCMVHDALDAAESIVVRIGRQTGWGRNPGWGERRIGGHSIGRRYGLLVLLHGVHTGVKLGWSARCEV
jgi:hypothetical protein